MSKHSIHFNDYVSLAVMLLMVVALVSGQAGANAATTEGDVTRSSVSFSLDAGEIELTGNARANSLEISVDIDTKPDYFRGEDE